MKFLLENSETGFQKAETRFQNAETRFQNAKTALSCIFFARTWMDSAQKKTRTPWTPFDIKIVSTVKITYFHAINIISVHG